MKLLTTAILYTLFVMHDVVWAHGEVIDEHASGVSNAPSGFIVAAVAGAITVAVVVFLNTRKKS